MPLQEEFACCTAITGVAAAGAVVAGTSQHQLAGQMSGLLHEWDAGKEVPRMQQKNEPP